MAGALFCRHCGYPLWEEVARRTGGDQGRRGASGRPARGPVHLRLPDGRVITLSGSGPWLIGRPSDAVLPDVDAQALGARHVSRQHARLEWRREGLFVVDLASTNGTWVNGQRLSPYEPQRLRDGDWVRWADLDVQILLPPQDRVSPTSQEERRV